MKLLDPLGGILTTTGSVIMHYLYFITYLCLIFQSFEFSLDAKDLSHYCGWYLIPSHLSVLIVAFYKVQKLTYYQGLQYAALYCALLYYWITILMITHAHIRNALFK